MSFQRTAANALASSTALRYEGLRRITTSKLAHKLQVLEHRALQRDRSFQRDELQHKKLIPLCRFLLKRTSSSISRCER